MRSRCGGRQAGFSLIEALVILVLVGTLTAYALPRLRETESTRVRRAAQQLVRDLETVRSRVLATRSAGRVVFTPGLRSYTAYLDDNRDGLIGQTTGETDSLRSFRSRTLDSGIQFGRTGAPDVPGFAGPGAITLPGARLDFGTRGLPAPLGTSGVIYLSSASDPNAVAAVTVTGAAGLRAWVLLGGVWQ